MARGRKLTLIVVLLTVITVLLWVELGGTLRQEVARRAKVAQQEQAEAAFEATLKFGETATPPNYTDPTGGVKYVAPLGKIPDEVSHPTPEKVR